jgi:hypothetical protein
VSPDRHARTMLPIPDRPSFGLTTYDAKDPDTAYPPIEPLVPPEGAPNVLIILLDDVGFGASSTFGGPVVRRQQTGWPRVDCGTTASTPRRSWTSRTTVVDWPKAATSRCITTGQRSAPAASGQPSRWSSRLTRRPTSATSPVPRSHPTTARATAGSRARSTGCKLILARMIMITSSTRRSGSVSPCPGSSEVLVAAGARKAIPGG